MKTIIFLFGIFGYWVICSLIIAVPVWLLWNWLIPPIFGLIKINLLQSFGLSLLIKALFYFNPEVKY